MCLMIMCIILLSLRYDTMKTCCVSDDKTHHDDRQGSISNHLEGTIGTRERIRRVSVGDRVED